MTYPTAPIHLYKLITGETVIGYFFGEEETNARTGTKAHRIKHIRRVNSYFELGDWFVGVHPDETQMMIPVSTIIVYAEEDKIDERLLETYRYETR